MESFARKYFDLLTNEYKGINLTRINDFNDFYNKQILDSVKPYDESGIFNTVINRTKLMVDIGFGGGFPILPMAKKLTDIKFVGIETRNKKVKVVSEIADKLNLNNIVLHHSRIENIYLDKECICTFKAVGKVNDFLQKINTNKEIYVFFYKGPNFYDLEDNQINMAKKEWEVIEEKEVVVPGTEKRFLIGFKNKKVPCGTKNLKNLVNLSTIL